MRKKEIHKLVRDTRLKSGLSQRDVALSMGLTSGQYVSNVERGMCPPSDDLLEWVAHRVPMKVLKNAMLADFSDDTDLKLFGFYGGKK